MSFLDDIAKYAPTIGGVLGGVGGEIVDPFGGGIAGAALGSGLGKAVENESQGKGLGGVSDLEAAGEGAVGQGAGDLLGGAIGAVGSTLGKYGENVAAKDATGKAAQDIVDEWKPVQNTPEFQNFDKATSIANDAGLKPTAQNFHDIGTAGTGEGGLYNTKLDNIVKGQGNVDFTSVPKAVEDALTKHGAELGEGANGAQSNSVRSVVMDDLAPGTGKNYVDAINAGINPGDPATGIGVGSASGKTMTEQILGKKLTDIAPEDALSTLRQVRTLRDNQSATNPSGMALKKIYSDIFDTIKSSIYDRPEIDTEVAKSTLTPEEEQALNIATNGNTKAAEYLKNGWNNAKTSGEVNNAQADLVNTRNLGDVALKNQATKGVLTDAQQTAKDALQSGEAPKVPLSKEAALGHVIKQGAKVRGPIATKAGGILERMSPFTGKPLDDAEPMLHPTILSKLNPAGNPSGVLNKVPGAMGTTIATSPNVAQGATMNGQPALNTQSISGPTATPQGGQLSPYAQIMQQIGTDPFLSSSLAPLANTLLPGVQKAETAEAQLPALAQSFQAAGGAQGPLGGLLAKIGSAFGGGETSKYTAQQKELMSLLQSLGISTANVPSITESPQAAQAGLSQIQGGLSGVLAGVPGQ